MSPTQDRDAQRLDIAVSTRQSEIDRFWQRSLFFWGFTAAAGVGYVTAMEKVPLLAVPIACFGLVCSFAWTLGNRGSKYWQVQWEKKVEKAERQPIGRFFSEREAIPMKGVYGPRKFSVSKLAMALSDFTVVLWMCAIVNDAFVNFDMRLTGQLLQFARLLIPLLTFAYIFWMFKKCIADEDEDENLHRDR